MNRDGSVHWSDITRSFQRLDCSKELECPMLVFYLGKKHVCSLNEMANFGLPLRYLCWFATHHCEFDIDTSKSYKYTFYPQYLLKSFSSPSVSILS